MADEDQSGRLTEHNPANAPPPSTTGRPADMAVVTGAPRPAVLLLYLALILIGVPVWWRTTEVYRAAIPFEKLDAERASEPPKLPVRLVLAKELGGNVGDAARWLEEHVNRHVDPVRDGIRVAVDGMELQSRLPGTMLDDWEMDEWLRDSGPQRAAGGETGDYTVFILPEGKRGAFRADAGGRRLVMGKGMAGWLLVSPDPSKLMTSMQVLPKMLAAVVRGEDQEASSALVEATAAGAKAGAASARFSGEIEAREVGQPRALRVTLSLLVGCSSDLPAAAEVGHGADGSDICGRGPVKWEAKEAVDSMMAPLIQRLQGAYNLTVDSQVLHYADLAVPPVFSEEHQAFVLQSATLNDFINWRDWPLDSTSSLHRTMHLLLYLPSIHVSPLIILDRTLEPLKPPAFSVGGYGAVHLLSDASLLSPSSDGGGVIRQEDLREAMASLVGQLRALLGLKTPPGVLAMPDYSTGAPGWQLDMMKRRVARARMATARSTLRSLRGLIESIPNMMIDDDIGRRVTEALMHIVEAERLWSAGRFSAAEEVAAVAFEAAEEVFFDKSVLSRLYFPDDHKMAVYIPYFVPVLLPLAVGVLREGKAYAARRKAKLE